MYGQFTVAAFFLNFNSHGLDGEVLTIAASGTGFATAAGEALYAIISYAKNSQGGLTIEDAVIVTVVVAADIPDSIDIKNERLTQ